MTYLVYLSTLISYINLIIKIFSKFYSKRGNAWEREGTRGNAFRKNKKRILVFFANMYFYNVILIDLH